jgi:glycosyltransferase involved in cell wall biosynthesis
MIDSKHVARRVLMIVENNSVPFDRRVWQEAEALRDAGFEVTIISPRTARATRFRETLAGIRILRHPRIVEAARPWQYAIEYANALFWEIVLSMGVVVSRRVHVVHIANPPDGVFILGRLLRLFGCRVVFDQHDLGPEIYEAKFADRGFLWRMVRFSERASYRAAHVVITSNESMKRMAIERGGRGEENVFVVRNGPKLDRLANAHPIESIKQGRRFMVCYMGIIGSQEGLEGLIRIIDDIVRVRGRVDTQFVIVGDGTGLKALRAEATALDLDDFVTFTGYLTGSMLTDTLETADICVCPEPATPLNDSSTFVKTMEYMARAKPVVQYDLTEARVTAGDTALYAKRDDESELADKIVYLLDHPEARRDLGTRAAARVQTSLAWDHQVPSLLSAYAAALNGHGDV